MRVDLKQSSGTVFPFHRPRDRLKSATDMLSNRLIQRFKLGLLAGIRRCDVATFRKRSPCVRASPRRIHSKRFGNLQLGPIAQDRRSVDDGVKLPNISRPGIRAKQLLIAVRRLDHV